MAKRRNGLHKRVIGEENKRPGEENQRAKSIRRYNEFLEGQECVEDQMLKEEAGYIREVE